MTESETPREAFIRKYLAAPEDVQRNVDEALRDHEIRELPRLTPKAKRALWATFDAQHPGLRDAKGYLKKWEDNLLPGIEIDDFESDMKGGSGNELESKFKAVHSSSALAVNSFAPFRRKPGNLRICGIEGLTFRQFEKKLPTALKGATPNLDGFADSDTHVVAVESKLLEYLTPKEVKFSRSYHRKHFPSAEDCWWRVLEEYGRTRYPRTRFLDVAQLVKHYLGLCSHDFGDKQVCLVYLFWEPQNTGDYAKLFNSHRSEIKELSEHVSDSRIRFLWKSYPELWDEWKSAEIMPGHIRKLRDRYMAVI